MIGLGTANLGIGIAVNLRNNFTAQASRVNASMRSMSAAQRQLLQSNLIGMRNMGLGVATIGIGLGMALHGAIKEVAKFDNVMQAVKANTAISTDQLSKLKQEAIDLGKEFGFMPQKIAESMKDVSKAVDIKGMGTKGLYNLTKDALMLAVVGDTDVGGERGSAEILINIMSQFEMQANRSLEVVDKLAMTANKTTTDVKGLAESFKYGGSEAHRLGLTLDETLALFGTLGQAGLKGSLGGTTAGNFLRYLTKSVSDFRTTRQSEGLAMMGLRPEDIMDSKGNLMDLSTVLTRVKTSLKGMSTVSRQSAMEAVFGVRGSRAEAVLNMLDKANFGAGFKDLLKYLQNSGGYAAKQMAVRMETYQKRMEKLNAAVFDFKHALSETFVPLLIPLVNGLASIVSLLAKAAKTPLGKFLIILAGVTIALAAIGGTISFILGGLGSLLLVSKASFGGMAKAARWAFRMMGVEAMLFQRKATAALIFNEGLGRFMNGRTGRMVSGKVADRYKRMYGGRGGGIGGMLMNILSFLPMGGKIRGFGGMLGRTGGLMTRFGGLLMRFLPMALRFIPVIGIIISVLSLFMDFKDMLNGLVFVIGTIIQALYGAIQFINPFSDSFLDMTKTAEDFNRRQGTLKESLGYGSSSDEDMAQNRRASKFYSPYVSQGYNDKQDEWFKKTNLNYKQKQTVNVNLDGRKISEHVSNTSDALLVDGPPIK